MIEISTMIERFKEMRNAFGLSQAKFANRVHVTPAAIGNIEAGNSNPSEMLLLNICREFGVSEEWLKTGEGEMLAPIEEKARIAGFIGDTLNVPDSFKFRLISTLAQLSPAEWDMLADIAERLYKEHGGKDKGE